MHIEELAQLQSPSGALVSLYLDRPPRPSAAALTDLLKPIRARAERLDRTASLSVRSDIERISALDARIDADPAPAFMVFASGIDGIFHFEPLQHPAWNHASLGRRPYLRPLRARPEQLRAGVVVADRRKASVFVSNGTSLRPLGERVVGEHLKGNFGGFRGYEEHRVRQHADEETRRVLDAVAGRLFEEHRRHPFDFLSMGGHQETADWVVSHLHPYLRRLPVLHFVVDPHTMTVPELRARAEEQACEVRRRRQQEVIESTVEAVEGTSLGVAGTAPVLEAANAHAVERLVVSGTFSRPGVACPSCGWLGRSGSDCPACSSRLEETEDVVAEAMEAVAATGGDVHQVDVASRIDARGVAASLRFPVG